MKKTEIAYLVLAFFIGLFVPWWVVPLKEGAQVNAAIILLTASLLAMLRVVKDSWWLQPCWFSPEPAGHIGPKDFAGGCCLGTL